MEYTINDCDEVNYIKWLTLQNCSPIIKLDCLYIEGKLDMVQSKQKCFILLNWSMEKNKSIWFCFTFKKKILP